MSNLSFNALLYGATSKIWIDCDLDKSNHINSKSVVKALAAISEKYVCSNFTSLETLSQVVDQGFESALEDSLLKINGDLVKDGTILRKSFFNRKLSNFTPEETDAIYAQYVITYGFASDFAKHHFAAAVDTLGKYVDTFTADVEAIGNKTKPVEFIDNSGLIKYLSDLLGSKRVLTAQEKQLIKKAPSTLLVKAISDCGSIQIKETMVMVADLIFTEKLDVTVFKTHTDVLRYILHSCSTDTEYDGGLEKARLREAEYKIPTSKRKWLLSQLNTISKKNLVDDLFTFREEWLFILKYLSFAKQDKMFNRYPSFFKHIELLQKKDKSGVFSSRYGKAMAQYDLDSAIRVAAENPGFLARNMMYFIKFYTGDLVPQKLGKTEVCNPLTDYMSSKNDKRIKTDVVQFLESDEFEEVLDKINLKLRWQLLQQVFAIDNDKLDTYTTERDIRSGVVHYAEAAPYPFPKSKLSYLLQHKLFKSVKTSLRSLNGEQLIWLDPKVKNIAVQFSGAESKEMVLSGEVLTPGSSVPISELLDRCEEKGKKYLRFGVLWRGKEIGYSSDIDLSTTILLPKKDSSKEVSWRNTSFQVGSDVIATSTGDITSCASGAAAKFSTEFIDIDIKKLKKMDSDAKIFNFINMYSGSSMDDFEVYFFVDFVSRKDLPKAGYGRTNVNVDLGAVEYSAQLNNGSKTGTLGFWLDFEKDEMVVVNRAIDIGYSSGIWAVQGMVENILEELDETLTLNDVFNIGYGADQLVDDPEDATVIISRNHSYDKDGVTFIHPTKDVLNLNKLWMGE